MATANKAVSFSVQTMIEESNCATRVTVMKNRIMKVKVDETFSNVFEILRKEFLSGSLTGKERWRRLMQRNRD